MGGFGSGRHGGKSVTANMKALDVRLLQRKGALKPGASFTWTWSLGRQVVGTINATAAHDRVTLDYRQREHGGEWKPMNYPVRLTWTTCNYGGRRAWWYCPAVGCGRRVAVLFGGTVFACRHCHRLAYACQRESPDDRATRQADKLRDRLGWEPGILNGNGGKPKGMHWQTFERLETQHDALVHVSLIGMAARFGLAVGRLGDVNEVADRMLDACR